MLGTENNTPVVLIADDQPHIGEALRLLLRTEGIQTELADSPGIVIKAVGGRRFDAVLMDLNYSRDTTSGQEGLALVTSLQGLDPTLPIIVMTGWGSVPLAVEAMRRGARDFVAKPWDNVELLKTVLAQVEFGRRQRQSAQLKRAEQVEYEEAARVQRRLLPQTIPQISGVQIAAEWLPARQVGGDYFDVSKLGDSQVEMCIADVSGKGWPAALLMANLQAAVKSAALDGQGPKGLCEGVNRILCQNSDKGRFVTFFYCVVDAARRTATYVNAGHNPPLVARANGTVERLSEGGTVLGVFPESKYAQGLVHFEPGDQLALYTDGLVEAQDGQEMEFGEARLAALLSAERALPAAQLQQRILGSVTEYCNGKFDDDATLIVLSIV
jgi:sigma-B regulation protein RsbU (phosphoserine phosphatase)